MMDRIVLVCYVTWPVQLAPVEHPVHHAIQDTTTMHLNHFVIYVGTHVLLVMMDQHVLHALALHIVYSSRFNAHAMVDIMTMDLTRHVFSVDTHVQLVLLEQLVLHALVLHSEQLVYLNAHAMPFTTMMDKILCVLRV